MTFSPTLSKQENKCWVADASQRSTIPRLSLTKNKTLVLICLTSNKFSLQAIPYGTKINAEFYIEFLKRTGNRWRTLHSNPTTLRQLHFQHDNARPHAALLTQQFLEQIQIIQIINQSPYSPDFNMLDRWVNAHIKFRFKLWIFFSAQEVEEATLQVL